MNLNMNQKQAKRYFQINDQIYLCLMKSLTIQFIKTTMNKNLIGQQLKTFNIIKILGEGAWATVYQAIDDRNNKTVAVKAIPKSLIKQTPKLEQLLKTEIKVLKSCNNDNVIGFVDSFKSDKYIFVVMEYCNGGDLEEYLEKKKSISEDEAIMFIKQIINGFKGLHEVGAMHRDFKTANVLLHNRVCKIADLGFAKQMQRKALTSTVLGTSLTMAPQVLEERPYGFEADIWSLGVVFYQMIYGKYPYTGRTDYDILRKIKGTRPDFSKIQISSNAKDFIEKCLTVDIKKRIKWAQIYSHPLIKKEEKHFVYGLKSKLSINENMDFYNKGLPEKNSYPDIKKKDVFDILGVHFDEVTKNNPQDINSILNEANNLRQKEQSFAEIEKQYLDRRNDIYFVLKFINPQIQNFQTIKVNHAVALFIFSKRSYIDMKAFSKSIQKKENIFKIEKYFDDFTKSNIYQNLLEQIKTDLNEIQQSCASYVSSLKFYSEDIKKEFNVDKVVKSDFNSFSNDTARDYWFLLAQYLNSFRGETKKDLIKILQALSYYQSSQKVSVAEFDRKMTILDFEQAEKDILKKYQAHHE